MHKPLSSDELAVLQKDHPIDETPAKLTRKQKLNRLADLIASGATTFYLYHRLEFMSDEGLASIPVEASQPTAFGAMLKDATLQADGVGSAPQTVKGMRDYLELTTAELHEFSCDCGGSLSNTTMAERVRKLADGSPGV